MAAEFDVTLSALEKTASTIRTQMDEFKEQAQNTLTAAQALGDTWEGDSKEEFITNMGELKKWMDTMAETMETYADALDKAADTYEKADVNSAKNF